MKNIVTLITLILAIGIITLSFILKPELTGDGSEYYLMLESLYNHGTPELRVKDIKSFDNKENKFGFKYYKFNETNAYSGYFKANNGNYYSYHFWSYSLINLPVKILLETFRMDVLKVFQITNAILISLLLLLISREMSLSRIKRLILIAFTIFNPILWFIFWSHPELFCYVFIIASILFFFKGKLNIAILLTSIASLQNLPLIILPAILMLYRIYLTLKANNFRLTKPQNFNILKTLKELIIPLIFSLIGLIPPIFYYINFKTISLISSSGGTDNSLISFKRIGELFIDLNIGIFPYMPLIFILCVAIFVYLFAKFKNLRLILLISLLSLIFILALASSTTNWNHGTTGPSRYTLWSILPFMFLTLYLLFKNARLNRYFTFAFIISILINLTLLLAVFLPGVSFGNLNHSYLSKFVLDNFQVIYNPTTEIFAERTLGKEAIDLKNTTIIYGDCNKILYKGEYVSDILLCK